MRPPRHILMTADTIGGVWIYALDLCASLGRYGITVTLVSTGQLPDESKMAEVRRLDNVMLVPTAYRTEWMENCEDDLRQLGEELLRIERDVDPDIVHMNGFGHAGLSFQAPAVVVAHSCVSSWWKHCRSTPLPGSWAAYEARVSQCVAEADALVAPTEAFLCEFQSLHGEARHARAIFNGRPAARFRPGVKRRIVLAAGRVWDDAKNIDLLRRVSDDIDVPIVVAGELVAPDGSLFEACGMAALGQLSQTELARWMSEAAIYANPARYEPFGLGVLEAALSGCALILGDIPSLRELWDGVATFIDPDDLPGARRAIRMLCEMPQLAASDGRKARERALAYTVEKMGDAYYQLYRDVMAGHAALGEVAA